MNYGHHLIDASAVDIAARVVEEAYRSLVAAAQYPSLPHELTSEFLAGVTPEALTPEEKVALTQEYDADLRLSGLLDKFLTALSSRQAKLLVKDKALYELIGIKDGLRSFADFRGQQSGKGARVAVQELEVAQTLIETPSAQRAVDAGEITFDHVEVLSKAVSRISRRGDDTLTAAEEAELVEMGKGCTADEYTRVASRYLNGRNPLGHDASQSQIRRKRYFQVAYTPVGAHIRGFIDPVAAQTLRLALEAATPTPATDDDRSYEQRSADALEAVANLALNTGELKTGALVRPHLSFIMTEKTFRDATRELARREQVATPQTTTCQDVSCRDNSREDASTPLDSKALPDLGLEDGGKNASGPAGPAKPTGPALATPTAMEPAEFEDGTTIPLNELTRLLCDSQITRVVLNADGSPMNIGRTQRLYAKELRRAIIARDRSCRAAGCSMAARWSEIHHIQWWDKDNGPTSIENGVLCCRFHHGQIHDRVLKVIHDEHGLPQIVPNNTDSAPGADHASNATQHEPALVTAQGTNVSTSQFSRPAEVPKLKRNSQIESQPIGLWGNPEPKSSANPISDSWQQNYSP